MRRRGARRGGGVMEIVGRLWGGAVKCMKTFWTYLANIRLLLAVGSWLYWTILFPSWPVLQFYIFKVYGYDYHPYDWKAYMDEVEEFINGTYDYTQLKGDPGPLMMHDYTQMKGGGGLLLYPAGSVYVFTALYYLTSHGVEIAVGQAIFAVVYFFILVQVFSIYNRFGKVPGYVVVFVCAEVFRRTIFLLRLFDDAVAMLLLFGAINLFLEGHWTLGCGIYSLALSVKMNVLLFFPGLLFLLLAKFGLIRTIARLALCAAIQLLLGLPFLLENPVGYMSRAFDRQFMFEWTINWHFLPEWLFLSWYFDLLLWAAYLYTLVLFLRHQWMRPTDSWVEWKTRLVELMKKPSERKKRFSFFSKFRKTPTENKIVLILFTSNFIGMCFSHSLHYFNYVWYLHTLPYLLWSGPEGVRWVKKHCSDKVFGWFNNLYVLVVFRLLILVWMDWSWNRWWSVDTYPSTNLRSASLHVCHLIMLWFLWQAPWAH